MFLNKCLTCITISSILLSCGAGKQLDAPAWYEHPAAVDTSKLRFDGYYTISNDTGYTLDKYSAVNPVFFTPKNKIYVSHGAYIKTDSSLFTCAFYKKMGADRLGVYIIEGNKITAFVPVVVSIGEGALYYTYNLHFSGIIVDKGTITNWSAVPPYPDKIKKRDLENPQNSGFFREHDLKFIQADSIACLNP